MQSKMVLKIFFLYNPIKFLAILYPKSLANLEVEEGTRHSHQILLKWWNFPQQFWYLSCIYLLDSSWTLYEITTETVDWAGNDAPLLS